MARNNRRTASLVIALLGTLFNFAIVVQVVSTWRSMKWELDTEWEGVVDIWKIDGLKIVLGMLAAYFSAAATASFFGLLGTVKVRPF